MKKRSISSEIKPFIYSLEMVEEKISYYKFEMEENRNGAYHVTNSLLNFWKNYKKIHYPNEEQ